MLICRKVKQSSSQLQQPSAVKEMPIVDLKAAEFLQSLLSFLKRPA
jgi:hypothetical protein